MDLANSSLVDRLPEVRGRYAPGATMADLTWFRVGGPAEVLFTPEDEDDLAHFLKNLDEDIPVYVVGVGSNLLVRDKGIPGVVIRLGRGFAKIDILEDHKISCGTSVPDVMLARSAAKAGIGGLAFYRGIPGSIGGALRMNAGSYGTETKDILIEAVAYDRSGTRHVLSNADMGYAYRHCSCPDDYIFTSAVFQGKPGNTDEILAEMNKITEARESTQPVKSRTGGSTFKNPEGHKSWQLIDAAGMRGFRVGGAHVSEQHCNFLINDGEASASDLETLGESVRAKVKETSGVELSWEIRRVGVQEA